jgi:DNA repair exonuclease SbcCD ATPase subunit
MIHFSKVRYKNLLSTGSTFTEVQLDRSPTTLVTGKNGNGKSTMIEAIVVGLFNQSFRNINKPALVNSINKKDCVVEIEFTKGKNHYKVVRGIKPNKFEIYKDDELLNQDANSRNYQAYLEDHILGMNYKAFTQIVILGAASYTPFMSLPASSRREIIEALLDIDVFTGMNQLVSKKIKANKSAIQNNDSSLEVTKEKAKVQKNYIDNLLEDQKSRKDKLNAQLKEAQDELDELNRQSQTLETSLETTTGVMASLATKRDSYDNGTNIRRDLIADIKSKQRMVDGAKDTDTCPSCGQKVDNSSKLAHIEEIKNEIKVLEKKVALADERLKELEPFIDQYAKYEAELATIKADIKVCNGQKNIYNRQIEDINTQLKEDLDSKINDAKAVLKDYVTRGTELLREKTELGDDKRYLEICQILLKDDGIKSKIVKQYLGTINSLINGYLEKLDLFVSFELDETFNEVIRSRHRDDFTYESFSEGEKKRISLAIMFAFRDLAKMRNRMYANLLFADELLDQALDLQGKQDLLEFLGNVAENIFVISHNAEDWQDKFRSHIEIKKVSGYSVIA